jgi:hypothetical protein
MTAPYRCEFIRFGHIFESRDYPSMRICLDRWLGIESHCNPVLSPDIVSEEEIDIFVDELRRDLEIARKEAKKALRRCKARTAS